MAQRFGKEGKGITGYIMSRNISIFLSLSSEELLAFDRLLSGASSLIRKDSGITEEEIKAIYDRFKVAAYPNLIIAQQSKIQINKKGDKS